MSSTLLDLALGAHMEVERLERLIMKDLQNQPTRRKERLAQSHRIRLMIDTICSITLRLILIYEDKDNAMKDEYAALEGQTDTHIEAMVIERAEEIREYHRRHPAALVVGANEEHKVEPQVEFSGEEAYGRYLDLHELYNQYINSKFGEPIEYHAYLDVFSQLHKTPRKLKSTRQYREYVETLVQYLVSFFHRTEPLQDLDKIFAKVEAEFEEEWEIAMIHTSEHVRDQQTVIDLEYFSTVEELVELGAEKLKEALASLGLKIGGTIQQRAERLLLTKDTPLVKVDKKHFAKGSRCNGAPHQVGMLKEIAFMEAKLKKLSELLSEVIARTKDNIVKKQVLTYEEIAAEREDEETQADDDTESDDDEQQTYNPLKLPMGVDGKPIPYWLYKLHGLGQEFKCEICGNQSYQGRREFERHFKEGRHQHGMRCLGIPNTKNFNEITSIEEAQELWKGIQARQGVKRWRPELEEEYEDREGNVYNKKTYTDLKRQGLI
ncbi:PREDICTED: splicing factor 3A subunit 3-like [Fragaria vesca subsp. vesca]